jgi:hypothetical protein
MVQYFKDLQLGIHEYNSNSFINFQIVLNGNTINNDIANNNANGIQLIMLQNQLSQITLLITAVLEFG